MNSGCARCSISALAASGFLLALGIARRFGAIGETTPFGPPGSDEKRGRLEELGILRLRRDADRAGVGDEGRLAGEVGLVVAGAVPGGVARREELLVPGVLHPCQVGCASRRT